MVKVARYTVDHHCIVGNERIIIMISLQEYYELNSDNRDRIKHEIFSNMKTLILATTNMDAVQTTSVLNAYMDNIVFKLEDNIKENEALLQCLKNDKYEQLIRIFSIKNDSCLIRNIVESVGLKSYYDLCRICGLVHGTNVWKNNMELLLKTGQISQSDIVCFREDVLNHLVSYGISKERAMYYSEIIRKGAAYKLSDKDYQELEEHNVPHWFIEACKKILYLPSKEMSDKYAWIIWRLLYIHYII